MQSESQVVAVDNLWLCVAITLGMVLVIGLAQPFAQPQMNVLQSVCFACAWPFFVEIGIWTLKIPLARAGAGVWFSNVALSTWKECKPSAG